MTATDDLARAAPGLAGLDDSPAGRALLQVLDRTVVRVDRAGTVLGGWPVPDPAEPDPTVVVGSALLDGLITDGTRGAILATIAQCLDEGEPRSLEFAIGTADGDGDVAVEGRCAPCGADEVLWTWRDLGPGPAPRHLDEHRAGLEAIISDCLQMLIDVGGAETDFDELITTVMHRIGFYFGATVAFLDRFRGPHHVEIVGQWRATEVRYAPPGTSRGGPGYFPWAARKLARDPILIVSNLDVLGRESSTDLENLRADGERGFVWIRSGPARRPTGLFGLTFEGPPPVEQPASYEPLIGFASTMLAIVTRREEDARRREQHRVFESIARGDPLATVLAQVCRLRETGSPGQYCVAWLADDDGRLRPVDSGGSDVALDAFDPCPRDTPEVACFQAGERQWHSSTGGDVGSLGPVADRFGATAVDLQPLTTHAGDETVGVLAVYDTSRLPLDPREDPSGGWGDLAASLAVVAVERVTDLAELAHRATHDSLTGLANRETFLTELERAIAESGPVDRLVAVLYCDVDRFKELNDRLGHVHGDQFLLAIARLLESQVRAPALVGRLGGDEFVVLLERLTDENDALVVAERIRTAVRSSSVDPGRPTSVSIGVAVSGTAADHAEGLLRDADIAMYQAKSTGRDRVEVFAERIRREARARDRLARELGSALAEDDVEVHYQPMIDLQSGHLMGFEALARWMHPERGWVPPAEFIPIAETGGLIGTLGDVVLERSLELAATWNGLDLHVNLSARQIDTPGYVRSLLERIRGAAVPVERVAFEVTESVLLSESAPTVENLALLAEAGVGLVLDDFGTGYASLTYLRRFPFRGIKVDRSFVSGIEGSSDDAAIVSMVLALATTLGLEVIAEGVETLGQELRLREMGCRFVQGFRYSVPVPASDIPGLVDRFGAAGTPLF